MIFLYLLLFFIPLTFTVVAEGDIFEPATKTAEPSDETSPSIKVSEAQAREFERKDSQTIRTKSSSNQTRLQESAPDQTTKKSIHVTLAEPAEQKRELALQEHAKKKFSDVLFRKDKQAQDYAKQAKTLSPEIQDFLIEIGQGKTINITKEQASKITKELDDEITHIESNPDILPSFKKRYTKDLTLIKNLATEVERGKKISSAKELQSFDEILKIQRDLEQSPAAKKALAEKELNSQQQATRKSQRDKLVTHSTPADAYENNAAFAHDDTGNLVNFDPSKIQDETRDVLEQQLKELQSKSKSPEIEQEIAEIKQALAKHHEDLIPKFKTNDAQLQQKVRIENQISDTELEIDRSKKSLKTIINEDSTVVNINKQIKTLKNEISQLEKNLTPEQRKINDTLEKNLTPEQRKKIDALKKDLTPEQRKINDSLKSKNKELNYLQTQLTDASKAVLEKPEYQEEVQNLEKLKNSLETQRQQQNNLQARLSKQNTLQTYHQKQAAEHAKS